MPASAPPDIDPLTTAISELYLADEDAVVGTLLQRLSLDASQRARIRHQAEKLVIAVRQRQAGRGGIDAFLREYDLSSHEGIVLMCLAEALLRIPDPATADRLIRGKLMEGEWWRHLGHSRSLLVNASTWGLVLTGHLAALDDGVATGMTGVLGRLIARSGEPVVRRAIASAMRVLAAQFVFAETIEQAIERRREPALVHYRFSFDMLGEAALTRSDAERYLAAYRHAIDVVGGAGAERAYDDGADGISVKLSALHPRFEIFCRERVMEELVPRLLGLAHACREACVGLTIDAEETERLELTLDVFDAVLANPSLGDWHGLGIAVQAYQKRAIAVIDWLAERARRYRRRVPLRLVKGAYWDSEIKRAQQQGLADYPLFTRKAATDVSYLACARVVLRHGDAFYPQFATHNAHTVAALLEIGGPEQAFEFQRLHGMGEDLYAEIVPDRHLACRIYAPVGHHRELLPYLVRRLLENGANTSFVNRIGDESLPVAIVAADPVSAITVHPGANACIPKPEALYGGERRNARGLALTDMRTLGALLNDVHAALGREWRAQPVINGQRSDGPARDIVNPAHRHRIVGRVIDADDAVVERALDVASASFDAWNATRVDERARCLERAADLFERHGSELLALCIAEAGKTLGDALAEVREAVDYCRYYAAQARAMMGAPRRLHGVTGESNELRLSGRGVFVCISPWNFPLAIFTGQVTAALVTGNAVIAKPAEQTPLIAARATELLHEAGIPPGVLAIVPGRGETVGARLCRDDRTCGVAFTGSTETARAIQRALAARDAPIAPLIAETGGQNVMIVDSSALTEQVVRDAMRSAFNSAGQRCSALRVLYLQQDIADATLDMLRGAMNELRPGDPLLPATDIGPVIDVDALAQLQAHVARMDREAVLIGRTPLPGDCSAGTFLAPCAYEITRIGQLEREVFGPVLHVIRYHADALDAVIDEVNATGYGLTLGIHSRVDATIERIVRRARAGNIYVNRDMIGAVVGVQPFGGRGLSGTGPQAGGPHYLARFITETVVTVNTAALGGNPELLLAAKS